MAEANSALAGESPPSCRTTDPGEVGAARCRRRLASLLPAWLLILATCWATAACAVGSWLPGRNASGAPEGEGVTLATPGVKTKTSQAALQRDVQRFSDDFVSRISEAMDPLLRSDRAEVRQAAMHQVLLYVSSSTDIATGAQPELSLLDMIVFVTLSRETVIHHWVPEVYGVDGRPLAS